MIKTNILRFSPDFFEHKDRTYKDACCLMAFTDFPFVPSSNSRSRQHVVHYVYTTCSKKKTEYKAFSSVLLQSDGIATNLRNPKFTIRSKKSIAVPIFTTKRRIVSIVNSDAFAGRSLVFK